MAKMTKEDRSAVVQEWLGKAPGGMHLLAYSVQNILKVKFAQFTPQNSIVVVGGKNGAGKSSILKAIGYLLCGTDILPTDVIRVGQRVASIIGQVGPFKITRTFTRIPPEKSATGSRYHTRIKIEDAAGEDCPSPAELLKRLLGYMTFDPVAFLRLDAKKQCEEVKRLAKFDTDLDGIDAEIEKVYLQRREARYKLDDRRARLEAVPVPADASAVPSQADIAALTERLEGVATHNAHVDAAIRRREGYLAEAERKQARSIEIAGEIARLQAEQETLRTEAEAVTQMAATVFVDAKEDAAAVATELREAQAAYAAAGQSARRADMRAELTQAEAEWLALDATLEEMRQGRNQVMQRAVLPLPGLAIGEGELFYDGVPFNQASGAQQIRVSLAIGMANNPKIKVLRFLDGGWDMLDEDSQLMVRHEVEKHGFQLWVEHVGGNGATVVMEEGEARGPDVFQSEAAK